MKNIPFFRICLPFTAGILLSLHFNYPGIGLQVLMLPLIPATFLLLINKQNPVTKKIFLICTDVFLFLFGLNLVSEARINKNKDYYANVISTDTINKLLVVINDLPVEKENFYKCALKVTAAQKDTSFVNVKGNLIAYFKKDRNLPELKHGQTLLVNAKLLEVEPPLNPFEFDYKTYLENRQVFHICFLNRDDFETVKAPGQLPFLHKLGLDTRKWVLNRLKTSELTSHAYSICAALLTGYDQEIDQPVLEAFSHTGTLHVLSVSGLHTGLIYLVLSFLFDLFDRNKKYRLVKFIFITISLWFFALVTGFAAPVLRAVVMFNLFGLGTIFFRNNHRNRVNILLVSAFLLLCFNPFLIREIGFLLSYFALFGIIFYQPVFEKLWQPENKYLNYIWQSVTASFAATLTTLPFTLLWFKQFPLWFFICNLVVVPLAFLILLLAFLIVLNVSKVALLINFIVKFLIGFIALFNSAGIGFIDNIDFTWADSLMLSLIVILFSVTFHSRSYKYAMLTLLVIITWQINGIVASYLNKSKNIFTVYHIKKENVCSVKNSREVMIDSVSPRQYNFHVRPHLVSFNYPGVFKKKFNYIKSRNSAILLLSQKNCWPETDYKTVTTLVVSNNFKLSENDLGQIPALTKLVADGTNNAYAIRQLAELCAKFGIEFYSTREKGAYMMNL